LHNVCSLLFQRNRTQYHNALIQWFCQAEDERINKSRKERAMARMQLLQLGVFKRGTILHTCQKSTRWTQQKAPGQDSSIERASWLTSASLIDVWPTSTIEVQ
jgi:hypothetical protein